MAQVGSIDEKVQGQKSRWSVPLRYLDSDPDSEDQTNFRFGFTGEKRMRIHDDQKGGDPYFVQCVVDF